MGRRKIEIKAIKDDRNRSVTFLKRKGGLFKKAHELSVLCSVDVAVFIFGNNKKLYEYSSTDMRDLITRYQYHGGPNEHKGPSDFNGGDDDDDDDGDGTPPRGHEVLEHQMMPPQFHGHGQPPFAHIRHHTPSASPPVPNGGPFQPHPGHSGPPRGTTPQPAMGSRPGSRNDVRRMPPNNLVPQPHGAHPGITYMPTPPIYQGSNQPGMMGPQPAGQYPYSTHQHQQHLHQHQHHQHHQHQHQHQQQQPYVDERRPSAPPGYAPQPPPHVVPVIARPEPSPPPHINNQQQPLASQHPGPHISPPPQPDRRVHDPPPPPRVELKKEPLDRQQLGLNTDTAIKKLPQRKSHSIFTPIEENRSILSQHLASFTSESPGIKTESNRSQSVDASSRGGPSASPQLKRSSTQNSFDKSRAASVSSGPEKAFTPPSRSNSLMIGGPNGGGSRPRGPRLTVQIPDGASEPGSTGGESNSPHNPTITPTQAPRHSSVVLPPPSPSATSILSAGATGPPNPFARPPPQQGVNGETPVSALPSRFLNHEFLPSPSSFYPDWNFRGSDSNTLPSPLNFATPVVGTGPSFLRDENHGAGGSHNSSASNNSSGSASSTTATTAVTTATSGAASTAGAPGVTKRKSPDLGAGAQTEGQEGASDAKRVKVEYT
ncbi:MADS-box MEF2 type transcription factor [Metarhizium rileyi]|uniref:MADS-box MEF2 type transcription factor MIG1 n=1 Tax=Metarhizium rileyi (strain RCEF 4871) TaxID=1649241 RepID=A0A162JDD5_METRR|nr:MADS-box MEF2 type transcription factor [Metarhizium rileyi RCEF 4871]TWU76222.1 hypothetical protein ED733_004247 [Metarhizium rileyi]